MASIVKSEQERQVLEIAEKALLARGLRPVDVDCRLGPRSLLRVFISKVNQPSVSTENVSLDDCKWASETLSPLITDELIRGAYDLEVSSPGLDSRLRLKEDFEAAVGAEIKLVLVGSVEGIGGKTRGHLVSVDDDGIVVRVPGRPETKFLFTNVKQANRVWEFK